MGYLKKAKTEEEIKKTTVGQLRKEYNELAENYNNLLDLNFVYCPACNDFKTRSHFYQSKEYASGFFFMCKECVLERVEQRVKKSDEPHETKESVKDMLRLMNKPYIDSLYVKCCDLAAADTRSTKRSPFIIYHTQICSLNQYKGATWKNSEFDPEDIEKEDIIIEDTKKNAKIINNAKKRFGYNAGYSNEELFWLENEYQDWIARYPCDSKSQEVLFKTLCAQELEADTLRRKGKSTKDIDKSIQDTMSSLGIKPSQSNLDALADTQTFGQLIERWENERPIPEPTEEFRDVDKIGLYIDVFFKGHLSKMMGLKNAFSSIYEKYIKKYTVEKPDLNEEDEEALFNQIFGSDVDLDDA